MSLFLFLLMKLLSLASPIEIPPRNRSQELVAAIKEMQRANYFTFVMLINMLPIDTRLQGNVTFLMPKDRMLANMMMQEGDVSGFLLRHSIPSPLLYDTLEQFPTGTIIPSSLPNYMLKIFNNGRRNFVLNNVKISSPNICVLGSSIRCHGIDGVLSEEADSSVYSPPCPNNTSTCYRDSLPPIPPSPPHGDSLNPPLLIAPSPVEEDNSPQKSGSFQWLSYCGSFNFAICLSLSLVVISF